MFMQLLQPEQYQEQKYYLMKGEQISSFLVLGESPEMRQKEKKSFNPCNFYPKTETSQVKPVAENQRSLLVKHSQRA